MLDLFASGVGVTGSDLRERREKRLVSSSEGGCVEFRSVATLARSVESGLRVRWVLGPLEVGLSIALTSVGIGSLETFDGKSMMLTHDACHHHHCAWTCRSSSIPSG